eukprot:CAMPEP_0172883366 /NCGR_PEP_ID=MMETSP1075-20121228/122485_1 /TAXON_ID=2916 /ORGANISM="Ceratium fusus, Strain PA161109" /LENGTH=97 /DNA_ID=CAMNT_0013736233 /DNA_START=62 /DNA_END=352 /DNA_ORIENTATION=-
MESAGISGFVSEAAANAEVKTWQLNAVSVSNACRAGKEMKASTLAPATQGTQLGHGPLSWIASHPLPGPLPETGKLGEALAPAQQSMPSASEAKQPL